MTRAGSSPVHPAIFFFGPITKNGDPSSSHAVAQKAPMAAQQIIFPGGTSVAEVTERKRRGKRQIAFCDERSKSWVGNGCHPDGSRWRLRGFPHYESARSGAYETRGQGFQLPHPAHQGRRPRLTPIPELQSLHRLSLRKAQPHARSCCRLNPHGFLKNT